MVPSSDQSSTSTSLSIIAPSDAQLPVLPSLLRQYRSRLPLRSWTFPWLLRLPALLQKRFPSSSFPCSFSIVIWILLFLCRSVFFRPTHIHTKHYCQWSMLAPRNRNFQWYIPAHSIGYHSSARSSEYPPCQITPLSSRQREQRIRMRRPLPSSLIRYIRYRGKVSAICFIRCDSFSAGFQMKSGCSFTNISSHWLTLPCIFWIVSICTFSEKVGI